jgi:hypothetical protein
MSETAVAVAAPVSTGAPSTGSEGTPTPTAAQVAQMFKVKVDGNEREVSLEELQRGYTHGTAAQEKMRAAAEQRQMAEDVIRIFKENPREAFKKLGADPLKFAQELLSEQMENEMMTPGEKELKRLKALEADHLSRVKAQEDEAKSTKAAQEEKEMTDHIQNQIISVLDTAGLPKNQHTVGRIAFYWDSAVRAGFTDCTPADVIGHVQQEYQDDLRALLGGMPEDKLLAFMGDDGVKKTVKAHMNKIGVKKKASTVVDPALSPAAPTARKAPLSPSDFFRKGRKR